jgi:DNA-binding NtrC family response regulator
MNILCVEQDRTKLRQLKRDAREFVPGAHITVCRDPCKAEAMAKAKGCDVLLTDAVFDGFSLDGIMLAEQIRRVNPHVNIIFVTDHADISVANSAWELGASAFLLRPYEKQRLARALADPRFASE